MRLSPIQCMANLALWRPDAWTKKIRFPHLIRNSIKTAIFDYDFVDFWSEAIHGSFGLFLGTSEETAPEALHYTMYGKLLHTMRDNKIPHTMENHTMYEAYNVCTIQCIKTLIHSVKVSNPRYIPKCQPKHVFGKKKLKKHTNIQRYIIQQSEKLLKKGYVDERVVVLLYGSRNPGNLPGFQDLIIYRIRFRLISMYEENPGKLPTFSYIRIVKKLENQVTLLCMKVVNPGNLPGFRPPSVHT